MAQLKGLAAEGPEPAGHRVAGGQDHRPGRL